MQWPFKLFTLEQGTNASKRFKYIRAITSLIFIEEVITKEPASARWRVITPSKKICFYLANPFFHKAQERFTVNLFTAIINSVTAPVGVIANLLIVTAIFACPRLRTPSNLFVASLALSDVFIAVTVQPGYIAYRFMESKRRLVPCFVRIMYDV